MAIWHKRSETKKTGGKTRSYRKSRKYDLGSKFTEPTTGEQRIKKKRSRGGNEKSYVKQENELNLSVDGDVKRTEIEDVLENPANPNLVRRSLLTKGTIVKTPEGKARITSRPGQTGVVNAKLVEE